MKKKIGRIVWTIILTLSSLATFLGAKAFFVTFVYADTKDKVVTRTSSRIEPFGVESLLLNHRPFELGKKQRVEGEWLKDFSVTYRNNTEREMTCLTVDLYFPEAKQAQFGVAYTIAYGFPPIAGKQSARFPPVKPGETLTLKLDEKEFAKLSAFVGRYRTLDSLTHLDIRVSMAYFSDGTAWGGEFLEPKPDQPYVFVPRSKPEERQ